ncbi:MAG: hypothetical protein J7K00_05550 [Candidatus Diapherotrites archaeon]|nr:hypothetical protein [Candidatus Diapherotrites archaeon]
MKRGQLFSIDLVIAFFMMIVGISFILVYYEDIAYSIDHDLEMQKMQRIADDAAHLLMNHPMFLDDFDAGAMGDNEKIGGINYKNDAIISTFKSQGSVDLSAVPGNKHNLGAYGYTLDVNPGVPPGLCAGSSNIAKSQRIQKDGTLLEVYVC